MVATLDRFLLRLGDPGRYQIFALLLLSTNLFPITFNSVMVALFSVTPPHHCKLANEGNITDSIPIHTLDDGISVLDRCHMYEDPAKPMKGTIGCEYGYQYPENSVETTVVAQWDLVCGDRSLVALASTLYYTGASLGGPIFGFLSDKYGRKLLMITTLLCQAVIGIGVAFADSYTTYVILRLIQGALVQGLELASYTLLFESFSQKHRTTAGVVATALTSLAMLLTGLIGYTVQQWRYIQLALSLPSVAGLAYLWLIPDSIRWFVTHKRLDDAEFVAEFYARYNHVSLPATLPHEIDWLSRQLPVSHNDELQCDPRHLLKTPKLRKYSLIQFYIWFTIALASHGLMYHIPALGGNAYFSFMSIGGIAVASRLIQLFIMPKIGRRLSLGISCIITGVFCMISSLLNTYSGEQGSAISASVGCACLGIAFLSISTTCLRLLTAELYPTLIRTLGAGSCTFWGGLGNVLAPFLLLLARHTWPSFPMLFIGTVTIVAGLLAFFLPETQSMPLPDTVEDSENIETIYSTRLRRGIKFFHKSVRETVT